MEVFHEGPAFPNVLLDVAVMARLDEELKAFNHSNFPAVVSKSVFLETLLEYGLDNLDAIGTRIAKENPSEQDNA